MQHTGGSRTKDNQAYQPWVRVLCTYGNGTAELGNLRCTAVDIKTAKLKPLNRDFESSGVSTSEGSLSDFL